MELRKCGGLAVKTSNFGFLGWAASSSYRVLFSVREEESFLHFVVLGQPGVLNENRRHTAGGPDPTNNKYPIR